MTQPRPNPDTLSVGIIQAAFSDDLAANVAQMEAMIREAAGQGAKIILPPELFEGRYFPREEIEEAFELAQPVQDHPTLARMQALAAELEVVIPTSFFERAGHAYYNSLAMIDADGALLGVYRKSHIPDGPGYEEKFYFRPGDTGFKVWQTAGGPVGVGICWDQWFPEAARAMALMGAEILLYPTAIGAEPHDPGFDTRDPWRRAMIGHSVSNWMPVAASNRTGTESGQRFYGSSFIADAGGDLVADMDREEIGVRVARFDRRALARARAGMGFFRDRRPELYQALATGDGSV